MNAYQKLCDFGQAYLMQWTGQRAMFDLRRELMTHLQRLDVSYYDRNPVGRLITRVTTDVDVLNELFASGLVTIIGDLLMWNMIPKLDTCVHAVEGGVDAAVILDGRVPHAMLLEIFTRQGAGTLVHA